MQDVCTLPVNVGVATHVMTPSLVGHLGITSDALSSIFSSSQGRNVHTHPPPSTSKDIKKAMEKVHDYNANHLNTFLRGYMFGRAPVAEEVLSNIRRLSINSSGEWAFQCQSAALRMFLAELEARDTGVIPKAKHEDSLVLTELRQALPEYRGKPPSISLTCCHFRFVGDVDPENIEQNERNFSAKVSIRNDGISKCTIKVSEVYTVVDGEVVFGDYLGSSSGGDRNIRQGEVATFHFALRSPPKSQLSTFEQVIVLSVDVYVKVFVTFAILSPRQRSFGLGFPKCLALMVRGSPIGTYASPLMLQLLKHQFIRLQGLANKDIGHLLIGKSSNFATRNREIMREATRVKEILEEEMDFMEVLESYRSTLPKKSLGNFELPESFAQPAGYLPGGILPTAVAAVSSMSCFPNATTRLPTALTNTQPDVLMGLIMIFLAELDVTIFDSSLLLCEPMTYLESLLPYLRGVVLWIVDLCAGLLIHKSSNGVSLRHLALTFAALLMRKKLQFDAVNTYSVFIDPLAGDVKKEPQGNSLLADVALQQSAVTAFVHWITVFSSCYGKSSS
ncbi:uncharacterized protein TM35_000111080 [Trypanosoma theileri]|uniref:Uncharacterized protein n=1 Tax=Trypanosoma theileri TaxID=67003 RepID=A0A1X0NY27_9TRYP|nr:uncharacterized protein TM35_000111080 [Trypanosoma theileri]ORC89574.1 hypothetical protein TM35_000111080 [Trypanosoma theileri]